MQVVLVARLRASRGRSPPAQGGGVVGGSRLQWQLYVCVSGMHNKMYTHTIGMQSHCTQTVQNTSRYTASQNEPAYCNVYMHVDMHIVICI